MRRRDSGGDLVAEDLLTGGALSPSAHVVVEVCRCGCTPLDDTDPDGPDWPLATAWAWLTRPTDDVADDEPAEVDVEQSEERQDLPWWDARARPGRRRAVLPLVLLGELQAGVLLRAVYEVVKGKTGTPL